MPRTLCTARKGAPTYPARLRENVLPLEEAIGISGPDETTTVCRGG